MGNIYVFLRIYMRLGEILYLNLLFNYDIKGIFKFNVICFFLELLGVWNE